MPTGHKSPANCGYLGACRPINGKNRRKKTGTDGRVGRGNAKDRIEPT